MKIEQPRFVQIFALVLGLSLFSGVWAQATEDATNDSLPIILPFPFGGEDQFNPTESPAGFDFAWPENFNYEIVFDETTGLYSIQQRIGDTLLYRPSTYLTLDEYLDYDITGNLTEYWTDLQAEDDEAERAFAPKLTVDSELFETIFGSNEI